MRRPRRSHRSVEATAGRRTVEKRKRPRRASRSQRTGRGRASKRGCFSCRFEPLEARYLLSLAPGLFAGDSEAQTAVFNFAFEGAPLVDEIDGGVMVSLEGEDTWLSTGDPLMPVRESTILLPQGMEITSIDVTYLDAGELIADGVELLAAPAALPFSGATADVGLSNGFVSTSFGGEETVEYSNHSICGYNVGSLQVFPIQYDAVADTLTYHSEISVTVSVGALGSGATESIRSSDADRQRVVTLVDNPGAIDDYVLPTSTSAAGSSSLPADGGYEYVIITSSALESGFQPLVDQKLNRGLSAGIVTTEYIDANYSGTETGDRADRIRSFIADAYAHWGTQWVLLGGDVEVAPQRGVYASVGSTVDTSLPTDMYYACLDGPWNGDGDGLWGEANDGAGGGDIDLMADVYIGRAPVSNLTEAGNFVAKTIQYETTAHANANTAVWLGEQLDESTWGAYSATEIRDETIPDDWTLIEHYDLAGGWSGADLRDDLNASPHLVNHLGHANETYNARLYRSTVNALTNEDPYFMYSQGCMSGSFDTHDLSIAEQHVVDDHGALGVVMNSRYGWYVPGNNPGASHYYAEEFWDAVFNEGLTHLGQANQDSKDDNLFRVGSTGAYRWIHFETTLFGDPETSLQMDGPPQTAGGTIQGMVWDDANADGQEQAAEEALAGEVVFLDLNNNGQLDVGSTTTTSPETYVGIPDNGTVASTLTIQDGVAIADLNVTLDITHTYNADLEAYLVSPSGTRVELFTAVGGAGANFTDTTLDDEAALSIADATAPFSGSFRPEGRLSGFDGEDSGGTWTLQITDTMAWDTGTLEGWSLQISAEEPFVETGADGTYAFTELASATYHVRHDLPAGWSHADPVDGAFLVNVGAGEVVRGVDFLASEIPQLPPATELGSVDFLKIADLDLGGGDYWYACQTTRQGYLTVEALLPGSAGELEMKLYDASLVELASSAVSSEGERIDWNADAGETFYINVTGAASDFDLRLCNLVELDGRNLVVFGTNGDDRLDFAAGDWHEVAVNGVQYEFHSSSVTSVEFDGGAGCNTAILRGTTGEETAVLHAFRGTLTGQDYGVSVTQTARIVVVGQGGDDVAYLYDSAGDDRFIATPRYGKLYGDGFSNRAVSFRYVYAYATGGGADIAKLYDSAGDDTFVGTPTYGKLYGDGFSNRAVSFRYVHAYGRAGGADIAKLYDSAGDDTFVGTPGDGKLYGNGFYNRAVSFRYVHAYGRAGGADVAKLYDSAGDDTFVGTPDDGKLYGNGFYNRAVSFRYVHAYGRAGGADVASLYDSAGDDRFVGTPDYGKLYGNGFYNRAVSFRYVHAYASAGGIDMAKLYDSAGDDRFVGKPTFGKLYGDAFYNRAVSFRYVHAYATAGGADVARLYDSPGDDTFISRATSAKLFGDGFYNRAVSFPRVYAYATGGGVDRAKLYDSAGDDCLEASGNRARLSGDDLLACVYDFSWVRAISSQGGDDTKHVESVDYLLQTRGSWGEV